MKKKIGVFILVLFPLLALGGLFWFLHVKHQLPTQIVNKEKMPLEFKDNTVTCALCNMYLVGKKHTAQIITNDLKTHFFDDIGCAILWLKEQKIDPETITLWVFSTEINRYIDALKASYTFTEETPMLYGFAAYENPKEGMIDFTEMRLRMLRGENMSDPKIRKKLLGS
ncbi:hypothetical protein [Sulfurospirillum halorespirans]|uniref:Nitrous oxide reductase accessory protein NosL n=1 Tax=Sulfurospirillum halorespirans DSM 13726 TaxID=1193502 RepID=A0A1D7TGL4_9BACT|nr:hypothetical protein [Sulfurospirillum halorespirans]AOO64141.1 hypothetical protein SHALO_0344 [Sulfurospirillum halorespirans DSM 13726]